MIVWTCDLNDELVWERHYLSFDSTIDIPWPFVLAALHHRWSVSENSITSDAHYSEGTYAGRPAMQCTDYGVILIAVSGADRPPTPKYGEFVPSK
jgi:hypothetical protein